MLVEGSLAVGHFEADQKLEGREKLRYAEGERKVVVIWGLSTKSKLELECLSGYSAITFLFLENGDLAFPQAL
jgi:hypothetical protein